MKNLCWCLSLSALCAAAFITTNLLGAERATRNPSTPDASSLDLKLPPPGKEMAHFPYPETAPAHAKEYLRMHSAAGQTESPDWPRSLDNLVEKGDRGSLLFLKDLAMSKLEPSKLALLERTIAVLEGKVASSDAQVPVNILMQRLERAALADVTCHRLEVTQVAWAKKSAKAQLERPEVREALDKLVRAFTQAEQAGKDSTSDKLDSAYRARLAEYARSLLKQ